MKTTKKSPRKGRRPEPMFGLAVQRRRHTLMIHLTLEVRWLAGLLAALAGLWIGWEPLARLAQAVAKLP